MTTRRHLKSVPSLDDVSSDELLMAGIEFVVEQVNAAGILDGTMMVDHSADTIVSTVTGGPAAVTEVDAARRAGIRLVILEQGGEGALSFTVKTAAATDVRVGFSSLFEVWLCDCRLSAALEHEGGCCTHIATASSLARSNNPPAHWPAIPYRIREQLHNHANTRGY